MTIKFVGEVILFHENKILILKREANDNRRPNEWDIPGGHADFGESDIQVALRELYEEAGVRLDPSQLSLVYGLTEKPDETTTCTWVYFTAKTASTSVTLSPEHTESAWVTPEEAIELVKYHRHNAALRYIVENKLYP